MGNQTVDTDTFQEHPVSNRCQMTQNDDDPLG